MPLKIALYTNNSRDACAHLRCNGPLSLLGGEVTSGWEQGVLDLTPIDSADVVLVQRDFPRNTEAFERVASRAASTGKLLVYDIDDLLINLPEDHPERKSGVYTKSVLPILEAISTADLVTVPTQTLADDLSPLNEVKILPNYLDDSYWKLRPVVAPEDTNRPLVIGFMGGVSHMPDLEMITPALTQILDEFGDKVILRFWSIVPPRRIAIRKQVEALPAVSYEYIDFAKYFQTQQADIFLAPLTEHAFNRAKSHIKFLEYSALGAPGIYSDLEPYQSIVSHGVNGFLASDPEEWLNNLKILLNYPKLRLDMAREAQKTVAENHLMSAHAQVWQKAYEDLLGTSLRTPQEKKMAAIIRPVHQQYRDLIQAAEEKIALGEKKAENIQATLDDTQDALSLAKYELNDIKTSNVWKLAVLFRDAKMKALPASAPHTRLLGSMKRLLRGAKQPSHTESVRLDLDSGQPGCFALEPRQQPIDVIICVHNALEDVKRCVASVVQFSVDPYRVILVDDGSGAETKAFLEGVQQNHPDWILHRNEQATGYTLAANTGLRLSSAPLLVLLNSDTLVGPNWLERLSRAFNRSEKIGVVGPLSNTASWQSVPKLNDGDDWADNPLPDGVEASAMSDLIAKYSACILPEVPLLNGFCMMINRETIKDIGIFDEETFGQGYGEEDDFNLRAGVAGWKKLIADDVYVYHAQSKSYSHERRAELGRISGEKLKHKHGAEVIAEAVRHMNPNRVMEGIRARTAIIPEREATIATGRAFHAGKRILFVLPVVDAGGGANVIIEEALCMIAMGVDVQIFNLEKYGKQFKASYPDLTIPLMLGDETDLVEISRDFDAVVASANFSVPWLQPLARIPNGPVLGYYVQGYEPLMYPDHPDMAEQARLSYTLIPSMRNFTKTHWTQKEVFANTGNQPDIIGISINIDRYRPFHTRPLSGAHPVNIAAMVRTNSEYRNPEGTMSILKEIKQKYGSAVSIELFGTDDLKADISKENQNFIWNNYGKLNPMQVAMLMSQSDIFVDFSYHQAMGLTALEAMSAACAVIVPSNGGAIEFVQDKINGMVVDTSDQALSLQALDTLVSDHDLRHGFQVAGMRSVMSYYPEKAALNILGVLFTKRP